MTDDRHHSMTRISRSPDGRGFEVRWDGGGLIVPTDTAMRWTRFILSCGASARAMVRAYNEGVQYRCGACNHSWADLGGGKPADEVFCPRCGALQDVELLDTPAAVTGGDGA